MLKSPPKIKRNTRLHQVQLNVHLQVFLDLQLPSKDQIARSLVSPRIIRLALLIRERKPNKRPRKI